MDETRAIAVQMIREIGGEVRILEDCGGFPVIYAVFEPGPNGNPEKTLLFYNHYDVQPPEPLDEWTVPPFAGEIRDGKFYARGAADNKGELVARLNAIRLLQNHGGLPCRVKFLIEGEEEIGSPTLPAYLAKYADLFRADACIWEFGGKNADEKLEIVAGIKGMAYLQLWCKGAETDMHSSVGAVTDNAAWRLVQALASMRTADNQIIVEGFYDDVTPPSERILDIVRSITMRPDDFERRFGLKRPLITGDRDVREALVLDPTMTICGLESGYAGSGSKTVLPKRAQAKLDCRLVPDQDPDDILAKVRRHLDKHGFTDVEVTQINGEKAYRADPDHPFVQTVVETGRAAYGTDVVLWPNSAGTGPMHAFGEYLGLSLPIVSTGCGWWNSRAHAPDESIRVADFEQGMLHMILLMSAFGREA